MTSSQSVLAGALALTICVLGGCANKPPTMACKVSRTFIVEGEKTRIDANATDPDQKDRGQLSVSWSSSAGKLTRKNGSAEFDSTGLEPGKYQVSADVSDGKAAAPRFPRHVHDPLVYSVTIEMGGRSVATAFGIMNMSGNLGAAAFPAVVPFLLGPSQQDWSLVLVIFCLLFAAASVFWMLLKPQGTFESQSLLRK